jgi:hypothetical protein
MFQFYRLIEIKHQVSNTSSLIKKLNLAPTCIVLYRIKIQHKFQICEISKFWSPLRPLLMHKKSAIFYRNKIGINVKPHDHIHVPMIKISIFSNGGHL